MALMEVRGLTRSFYGIRALNGADLDIAPGTITGLICDEDWSNNEALAVCRQLGYTEGVASDSVVSLGQLPEGGIFYRDYKCDGNEELLELCPYTNLSQARQCDPAHIAQVVCGPPKG